LLPIAPAKRSPEAAVAAMMQGGPGYTHVPVVMRALDALVK
jgi:hypothetical protein